MRVLVTGGGGFLGQAVCQRLRTNGHDVVTLNRHVYPALTALGVDQRCSDLRHHDGVLAAARGCDAVVHTAALAGLWGSERLYREINVTGTANVLAACRTWSIGRLVHTSSPSVVHSGLDLDGVTEDVPYANRFLAPYPRTKAEAERLALGANGPDLAVTALRPHLIWGPGDPHLLPALLNAARAGRLRLIGAGDKLVDTTYVDNAAAAHVSALERLAVGAPPAGRAYFIAQGEPRPVRDVIESLLRAAGHEPGRLRSIPPRVAMSAAAMLEAVYRLARRPGPPPLTRFAVSQLATAHWFDLSAARRDLGYHPTVSTSEGLHRLREHMMAVRRDER